MNYTALLALEDGSLFYGKSIGVAGEVSAELVFNTAMTGYQEILTDPSYAQQIVTLTYPHIGNVGCNDEDQESSQVFVSGLVIRDLSLSTSNWRAKESLSSYLQKHGVIAIAGIDSRRLTRLLRDKGTLKGCIIAGKFDQQAAIRSAQSCAGLSGMDVATLVSTKTSYQWQADYSSPDSTQENSIPDAPLKPPFHVLVYDFGVKHNILRLLAAHGCRLTVVPASTNAQDVLKEEFDGVFLSNGPGDPAACDNAIAAIAQLLANNMPLFGICLGYQLLSLAVGAKTEKMKFGHHGTNHPVQCLQTHNVIITSQNHNFAVDEQSLPDFFKATHRSLFDNSLQGAQHTQFPAFGFQGHPEASPGPHDLQPLFKKFIDLMHTKKVINA